MKVLLLFAINIVNLSNLTPDGLQYASPQSPSKYFTSFPKIVWIYWAGGIDSTTLWTKLTINNIHHYSRLSGWQINYLTDQDYTRALSSGNNARMIKILEQQVNYQITVQAKSDVLRSMLMYEHGGAWIDAGSFFVQNLSWVDRLYEIPTVFNRFFPNPDIVLFTEIMITLVTKQRYLISSFNNKFICSRGFKIGLYQLNLGPIFLRTCLSLLIILSKQERKRPTKTLLLKVQNLVMNFGVIFSWEIFNINWQFKENKRLQIQQIILKQSMRYNTTKSGLYTHSILLFYFW